MSKELVEAHKALLRFRKASENGTNAAARADKVRASLHVQEIESDMRRQGQNPKVTYRGDNVEVKITQSPAKRSMQEAYVRDFDNKTIVKIGDKEQTLRQYHSKRVLNETIDADPDD